MRLSYRSAENILRLTLDEEMGEVAGVRQLHGVIDIGEQGRLVGIELDAVGEDLTGLFSTWLQDRIARDYVEIDDAGVYVALSAPGEDIPEQNLRTAELPLIAELDAYDRLIAITIPRRGDGYEISFPSGNQ